MKKNLEINVHLDYENYSVRFDNIDVSLEQIFNALTGILIAIGYPLETIEDYILEWANSIKEKDNAETDVNEID